MSTTTTSNPSPSPQWQLLLFSINSLYRFLGFLHNKDLCIIGTQSTPILQSYKYFLNNKLKYWQIFQCLANMVLCTDVKIINAECLEGKTAWSLLSLVLCGVKNSLQFSLSQKQWASFMIHVFLRRCKPLRGFWRMVGQIYEVFLRT